MDSLGLPAVQALPVAATSGLYQRRPDGLLVALLSSVILVVLVVLVVEAMEVVLLMASRE